MSILQMGTFLLRDIVSFPQIGTIGNDSIFHQISDAINYKMYLFYGAV